MARSGNVSREIGQALKAAGFLDDLNTVSRIVIDIRATHLPVVHVEHYGDERLIGMVALIGPAAVTSDG